MTELTHLNTHGEAHIVDVGAKDKTRRVAVAEGYIRMDAATLEAVEHQGIKKGDVMAVGRIAGLMGAKRTSELVPLCHPIALTNAEVTLEAWREGPGLRCEARAETVERTGVEMEALTAVQIALLTVYDMCKALDRGMEISGIRLLHKSGGRSGDWNAPSRSPVPR